jgi:hypothetical protein
MKSDEIEAIEELKVLKEKYDKAYDEFDKARDENNANKHRVRM